MHSHARSVPRVLLQRKLRRVTLVAVAAVAALLLVLAYRRAIESSDCRLTVAVLLVGDYNGPQNELMVAYRAIQASVVQPFAADVFAVTSVHTSRHHKAAASVFGANLKAFRSVPTSGCAYGDDHAASNATNAVELCAPPQEYADAVKPGRFLQWHKLRAAWNLLQAFEESRQDVRHTLIVKLRPDAVPILGSDPRTVLPWRIAPSCPWTGGHEGREQAKVLHAASDFAFFGDRVAMQAAVDVFDAMEAFFQRARPDPMRRQVAVAPLLRSIQHAPAECWRRSTWEFYNKVATLPYIEMSEERALVQRPLKDVTEGPGAYQRMETGLAQAAEAGIVVGDPERRGAPMQCDSSGRGHVRHRPCWAVMHGPIYSKWDYRRAAFTSEKDFLAWVINERNVTVCDFGLATDHFLYKGKTHARPSRPCG